MSIYITADPHFYHRNIIEYCDRPFKNVDQMNEVLIENWNKTVSNNDTIFIVGDFALTSKEKMVQCANKLNGKKILIKGNHDSFSSRCYLLDAGFKEVSSYPIIIEEFFILSHYPMFMNQHIPYFNLFGHVHNNEVFKDITTNAMCVCVERTNYTPISLEEIKERIKNLTLS